VIGPVVLALAGALFHAVLLRPLGPNERALAWVIFGVRMLSVWLNLLLVRIVYRNMADIAGYERVGQVYAERLSTDFRLWAEPVAAALVRVRVESYHFPMAPSATGVMNALATWIEWMFGNVAVSAGVLFALLSHGGLLLLYRSLREELVPRSRLPALLAICAVPSVLFWSSALLKEAVAMGFVAGLVAAVFRFYQTGRWRWGGWALVAAVPVWLIKPYLLAPLLVAAVVGAYLRRMGRAGRVRFRWSQVTRLFVPLLVGYGLLVLLLPEWSPTQVLEDAERMQELSMREDLSRGSKYTLVQPGEEITPLRLVLIAPLALLTALVRPLPGEVLNLQGIAASVEILLFSVAGFRLFVSTGLRRMGQAALDRPWIAFSIVFLFLGGLGVGIGTFNLGTLARYRMPLMPFYGLLVFVVPLLLRAERAPRRRAKRGALGSVAPSPRPAAEPGASVRHAPTAEVL
jgi:hypothetical protein